MTTPVVSQGTRALIERLPDGEAGLPLSGHDSPALTPNLPGLHADLGIRAGEHPRVDRPLDRMLAHQDPEGRYTPFALLTADPKPGDRRALAERAACLIRDNTTTQGRERTGGKRKWRKST